jgi:L-lysine exporter family protein LysE/ArgO
MGETTELERFPLISLLQGFRLGAGFIIAIGAQNAFVLRQGLKRRHLFVTASISTLCDAILILLGVGGLGALIASVPVLTVIATWGGALFLLFFGLRSFRSALDADKASTQPVSPGGTIFAVLAFSLLNPHVYLDTVVLVGSVVAHHQANERVSFAIGAMLASCTCCFSFAYGTGWLAPLFRRPQAW